MTPVNPACSFKSLAKLLFVDLHVAGVCTKRLPCGASGRIHKSDEGHPSDSLSSELMDEVVNTIVVAGGGVAAGVDTRAGRLRGGAGCTAGGHEPRAFPPGMPRKRTASDFR